MNLTHQMKKKKEKMKIESNVARTCNQFSQFLKERRSIGDVGFGNNIIVYPKLDNKEFCYNNNNNNNNNNNDNDTENKSLDLFPLTSSFFADPSKNMRNPVETKEETRGSMTIIYDGKVMVFDDLGEEMAQRIMSLGTTRGVVSSTAQSETTSCQGNNNEENIVRTHVSHDSLSHFPIQRGASLHRFMQKRKHRIAASTPYQLSNNSSLSKQQAEDQRLELKL